MKIGLSYSRCILDVVEGRVDIDDVLVIIAGTDFDPFIDDQWQNIWRGYNVREWRNSTKTEQEFRDATKNIWERGKFHQPRKFGWNPRRRPYYWLEAVLPSQELDTNLAVKDAWERFQVVAGLCNTTLHEKF